MPACVFWAVPPYFVACVWWLFFSHCLASHSEAKSLKLLKRIFLLPSLKMYRFYFQIVFSVSYSSYMEKETFFFSFPFK